MFSLDGFAPRLRSLQLLALGLCVLGLTGCGFALRGSYALPYQGVSVSSTGASVVAGQIRRELADTQTKVVSSAVEADAQLVVVDERRERQILSLSGAGRVREYELRLRIEYRAVRKDGTVLIPTSEIMLKRILPFNDERIIAKAQEEAQMYADMEKDAVGQILRRLIAVSR
jgi:LPS-assembly lipoprotein